MTSVNADTDDCMKIKHMPHSVTHEKYVQQQSAKWNNQTNRINTS